MKSHAASLSFESLLTDRTSTALNAPERLLARHRDHPELDVRTVLLDERDHPALAHEHRRSARRETLRVVLERPVVGFLRPVQMLDVVEQHARGGVDVLRNRHLHGAGLLPGLEHLHAGELVVEIAEFLRAAGRAGETQRDAGAGELARGVLLRQLLGILPDLGVALRRAVQAGRLADDRYCRTGRCGRTTTACPRACRRASRYPGTGYR